MHSNMIRPQIFQSLDPKNTIQIRKTCTINQQQIYNKIIKHDLLHQSVTNNSKSRSTSKVKVRSLNLTNINSINCQKNQSPQQNRDLLPLQQNQNLANQSIFSKIKGFEKESKPQNNYLQGENSQMQNLIKTKPLLENLKFGDSNKNQLSKEELQKINKTMISSSYKVSKERQISYQWPIMNKTFLNTQSLNPSVNTSIDTIPLFQSTYQHQNNIKNRSTSVFKQAYNKQRRQYYSINQVNSQFVNKDRPNTLDLIDFQIKNENNSQNSIENIKLTQKALNKVKLNRDQGQINNQSAFDIKTSKVQQFNMAELSEKQYMSQNKNKFYMSSAKGFGKNSTNRKNGNKLTLQPVKSVINSTFVKVEPGQGIPNANLDENFQKQSWNMVGNSNSLKNMGVMKFFEKFIQKQIKQYGKDIQEDQNTIQNPMMIKICGKIQSGEINLDKLKDLAEQIQKNESLAQKNGGNVMELFKKILSYKQMHNELVNIESSDRKLSLDGKLLKRVPNKQRSLSQDIDAIQGLSYDSQSQIELSHFQRYIKNGSPQKTYNNRYIARPFTQEQLQQVIDKHIGSPDKSKIKKTMSNFSSPQKGLDAWSTGNAEGDDFETRF